MKVRRVALTDLTAGGVLRDAGGSSPDAGGDHASPTVKELMQLGHEHTVRKG